MNLSNPLAALLVAAVIVSPALAETFNYKAPAGANFLLRDQAIGCYRGYSFSTSSTLADVAGYYDRQAQKSGLKRSVVQRRPGFRFANYHDANGFSLSVAVNARSKPTTATIMYRGRNRPPRC